MLNNEKVSTTHLLNLLFTTAEMIGENPEEVLRKVCNKCQIAFPERVSFEVISQKDFGRIKIGNELIFDSFQRKLIDNKIYYFVYENEDIHYEDYARYNANENSFKISDEISCTLDKDFHILGQLVQVSGEL